MANAIQKNRNGERPKNLNLTTIRLPINALVSIFHRLSGVVLFLLLPVLLWALQTSILDSAHFENLMQITSTWPMKIIMVLFSIPFFHHLYAGLRHLGQDVHWMTSLQKARFSGRVVLCLDAFSVLLFAMAIM